LPKLAIECLFWENDLNLCPQGITSPVQLSEYQYKARPMGSNRDIISKIRLRGYRGDCVINIDLNKRECAHTTLPEAGFGSTARTCRQINPGLIQTMNSVS
jgi:hypothetical protein